MLKLKTVYHPEWCKHTFINKSAMDEFHAFCKHCQADIDVNSKGKGAIEWHATTNKYKTNIHCAGKSYLA